MDKRTVTLILDGKTWAIDLSDAAAIRQIPAVERERLIAVLKEIELQHKLAEHAVNAAANRAQAAVTMTQGKGTARALPQQAGQPSVSSADRLGSGDVDDLMARLIMEEKRHQKPPLTADTVYKWMGIGLLVVALLTWMF